MSFSEAETLIEDRLKASWVRAEKVLFQNEDIQIPAGPFLHVMIIGEREEIAAFGGGRGRNEVEVDGRIEARAFVPINSGALKARQMRDAFSAIFRFQRFGAVTCMGATPIEGGTSSDRGNYYFVTAVVDFTYRFKG